MRHGLSRAALSAVLLAGALAARAAAAHPLAPSLLELIEQPAVAGHFAVRWRSEGRTADAPRLPARCQVTVPESLAVDPALGFVERRWEVDCGPRGLVGAVLAIAGPQEARRDALVRVRLRDGTTFGGLLRADASGWTLPARPRPATVAREYLGLGIHHLLTGADHVLFVLGLVGLVGARRRLVGAVTAFTAGHSVTLALAVLGFVHVPTALAEAAIAATLVALALELAESRPSDRAARRPIDRAARRPVDRAARTPMDRAARRPIRMAGAFGLLHGLGFAGALAQVGLPAGEIPLALFGFNLGIEIGQLAVVALALAAGLLGRGLARSLRPAFGPRLGSRHRSAGFPPMAGGLQPMARGLQPLARGLPLVPAYALGILGFCWGLERLL